MDFGRIDELIRKAQEPMADPWLEARNENYEPYRRFLYWLALDLRTPIIVELGVGTASTTSHLAAAAHEYGGKVYGFDNRPIRAQDIAERYPGSMRLMWCDTLGGAKTLEAEGKRIGLVFQDSSHHGEHSRCEWNLWKPLLAPGAVWVCDDVSSSFKMDDEPFGMLDYWAWLPVQDKHIYEVGRPGNGLGVALLP